MKKEKTMHARREMPTGDGKGCLRQYRVISREIVDDRCRLAQLSALYNPEKMRFGMAEAAHAFEGNPAGLPLGMPPIVELERYRELIEQNYRRCARLLGDIQEYINAIEDSELRSIFTFHYINGWTWQKIAFRINGQDESYPRKKHERYLKKHPFRPTVGTDAEGTEDQR